MEVFIMVINLGESEQYAVQAVCNECKRTFGLRVPKKDISTVKCGLCESSDITVFSSEPVRQVLME
jgi:hypothetical protein